MTDHLAETRNNLALANRILAQEGILDAFGHVGVRHPTEPRHYLIARHLASELVQPVDVLEFTLDSKPVVPTSSRLYDEIVIWLHLSSSTGCQFCMSPSRRCDPAVYFYRAKTEGH